MPQARARARADWPETAYDRDGLLDDPPVRRTIVIRGQVADRGMPAGHRRRGHSAIQRRALSKPDRFAMWAVLLGMLLVIVAATSAHT